MSKIKLKSIGSDPELFVKLKESDTIIPSDLVVAGDKFNPFDLGDGYKMHKDNIMCEFNTPACIIGEDFQSIINKGLELVQETLPEQLELKAWSSVPLTTSLKDSGSCNEFGCEPDYNAYTREKSETLDLTKTDFRYAGGHVHLGLDGKFADDDVINIVKYLDLYLGVPSVLLDGDLERKKYYGTAGRFRYKPYGLEYRTLSNFWIKDRANFVSSLTDRAVSSFAKNGSLSSEVESKVKQTVDSNDQALAYELCEEFEIKL